MWFSSSLTGETVPAIVSRFWGIFFFFFQSSQILGNLISSLVLRQDTSYNGTEGYQCGAQDCYTGKQCCVTWVGTRTRVHFTRTRTRGQFFFFHFDSDSEIVTRDSGPSHAQVQAVAAVPCCAVCSDIRYILLFIFMSWKIDKMLNMRTTRFVTRTLIFVLTRTLRWWLGLGLGLWGDDSDLTTWTRTQHCW